MKYQQPSKMDQQLRQFQEKELTQWHQMALVTFTPEKTFTGVGTGVTVKRVDKNGTPATLNTPQQ